MSESEVVEYEVEPGERADRVVELEERMRELDSFDESDPDVALDVSMDGMSSVRTARVLESRSEDRGSMRDVVLTVGIDGEVVEYSLPEPLSLDDESSYVVRLSRWGGVDPRWIGDLDRVPVVDADGRWMLMVPPVKRSQDVELKIGGGVFRFERPVLWSWVDVAGGWLMRMFLKTPMVKMCGTCHTHGFPRMRWVGLFVVLVSVLVSMLMGGVGNVLSLTTFGLMGMVSLLLLPFAVLVLWGGGTDFVYTRDR